MSKSPPPASKPVGTTEQHPQEQRAREMLTQAPLFLGVNGDGAAHLGQLRMGGRCRLRF